MECQATVRAFLPGIADAGRLQLRRAPWNRIQEENLSMSRRYCKSRAIRAAWGGCLAAAVLALAACGGSHTSTADPASPGPDPVAEQERGTVAVRVTTSSGAPLADVDVNLNGAFDGRTAYSDESGWVRFADMPAGEFSVSTYAPDFHFAHHQFVVASAADTEVTLILEHMAEVTPVVLNSRAVAASDGRSLTIDVDLALLDENGRAISALTASDFEMMDSDCAFAPCGYDADFGDMPMGGYAARADDEAFRWQVASDRPTPPMAVGLLLDQSADMAAFDPRRRRLPAVKAFLESILPPDTVSLATYRGTADGVDLTTYGPFTSDGARFVGAVEALAGQEAGSNPLSCAVADMQSLTATEAPSGPDAPNAAVVVVTSDSWNGGACFQEATSSTEGIPVVTMGGYVLGAAIAAGSGGSFVRVYHPLQFDVALKSLANIVGRTLDSNHLRFVLTPVGGVAAGPVFRPGRQSVWAYLYVRIGPHTRIEVPLAIQVQ
jgi:hypothetical protein